MSTSKIRVLYVDDEADVREVFASMFAEDFDVHLAESGDAVRGFAGTGAGWQIGIALALCSSS